MHTPGDCAPGDCDANPTNLRLSFEEATKSAKSVSSLRWLQMRYRSDIDGLRAIAVVPVVLFHAGMPGLSGGYLGVDVFFVISGFLITSILLSDIAEDRFSIISFYERRIRRIVPALVVMLICATTVAWCILLPNSLLEFSKSLVATATFSSNFLFYSQTGYFDPAAAGKPLLHTWSLAVEEQFYILFPLILFFLHKRGRVWLAGWLAFLAALSFSIGIWRYSQSPSEVFYMPYTRFWELLLGSILAMEIVKPSPSRVFMHVVGLTGIGLIIFGMVKGGGWRGLLPCIGAALVIYSGRCETSISRRILSLRPLVWIGIISYSLYLWHWPMIVFTEYALFRPATPQEMVSVIIAAVLFSTLSWWLVEQRFRRAALNRKQLLGGGLAALSMMAAVGIGTVASDGAKWRVPGAPRIDIAEADEAFGARKCLLDSDQNWSDWNASGCFLVGKTPSNILLWGDSFAAHYAPGLRKYASPSTGLLQYTTNGCPPAIGYLRESVPKCKANNDYALKIVQNYNIQKVILSARWAAYENKEELFRSLVTTVEMLSHAGIKVIVVGQSADFKFQFDDAERAAYLAWLDPTNNWRTVERLDLDATVNTELKGLTFPAMFFDPLSFICHQNICPILLEGRSLFIDHGHLSLFGSDTLGRPLAEVVDSNSGVKAERQ